MMSWFQVTLPDHYLSETDSLDEVAEKLADLMIEHRIGISFDHKSTVHWVAEDVERVMKNLGFELDLSSLVERNRHSYVHVYMADIERVLNDHKMVLILVGCFDDYLFFAFFEKTGLGEFERNPVYQYFEREKNSFLDPNNWSTWTVE